MRNVNRAIVAAAAIACVPTFALAKVQITVDLDAQTMHVASKDRTYDWKISSGADGFETPPGTYGVLWMDKDHKSDEYNQTPMPNAIFFKPGFAIHGAFKSAWGRPASHGCIRLPVAKSAILFDLVKQEGAEVTITGSDAPAAPIEASARQRTDPAAEADGYTYNAPANSPDLPGAGYAPQRPLSGFEGLFRGVY